MGRRAGLILSSSAAAVMFTFSVIGSPDFVPSELRDFYSDCNPKDVEVYIGELAVKFYPAEMLEEINREYDLKGCFVFSSCGSDPIFLHEGEIKTCPHGVKNPEFETLAENFDEFLEMIE